MNRFWFILNAKGTPFFLRFSVCFVHGIVEVIQWRKFKIKLKHYVSGLSLFSIAANSKYSKSF